ncbi:thiaminase II [Helicobacter pylori]|uniref:Putative transcriptional regulator n=1 Tax=Helicobacter pylori (strain SouthAfrica7) TaxID=907239 RepID=E8QTB9_HELPW|nr:thiaminase II [Helicobacter pylori]ADU85233.1 putative transcriptional regulator [Helicobacter pylori SouthAfrica7]
MQVSQYLYKSTQSIWGNCISHPFVQGIGHGTLEKDKFRFYIIQDYLFLLEYAKVFALGVIKASDEMVMREFSNAIQDILNNEMSIHNHYIKELQITLKELKNAHPTLANQSYTSYMLAEGFKGSIKEVTVAVLACAWSYLVIAQNLSQIPNALEHAFYGHWIKGYSSKEFQACVTWNINLLDSLTLASSKQEIEKLKDIFTTTSEYEYLFWDMAYQKS